MELIQVTYAEDKVERREVEALKKAREELKAKRCTAVTDNGKPRPLGRGAGSSKFLWQVGAWRTWGA